MYSPIDDYRCTATAVAAASRRCVHNVVWQQQQHVRCCLTQSRRERSQCGMTATAAVAGPLSFHTERSQCRMASNSSSSRSDVVSHRAFAT